MGHNVSLPSFCENTHNRTVFSTLYRADYLWSAYCMPLRPSMENIKREFTPALLTSVITQLMERLILFNNFHLDIGRESFTNTYLCYIQ